MTYKLTQDDFKRIHIIHKLSIFMNTFYTHNPKGKYKTHLGK